MTQTPAQHLSRAAPAVPRPVEVVIPSRPARIALAHDWLCGMRGGEMVLERLASLAALRAPAGERPPLLVMFDEGRSMAPAIDATRRIPSGLSGLPLASRLRRWMLPLYPRAVEQLSAALAAEHLRTPFDLLLSTSSAAIKGLRAPRGVPHVCYCHSPARYVWAQESEYARRGGLRGVGLRLYGPRFRRWDRESASNVDEFIANSAHTAAEIQRCYGRRADVVHPPVDTGFYTPGPARSREDFWLWVGALEPYKRFDLALEAARAAGVRFVVVGEGSMHGALAGSHAAHAEFLGRVARERLRDLYRRARLLVFPQVEDFGIAAGEALACGLPVLARRAGGALDIVDDGVTGALFGDPEAGAIAAAALRVPDPRDDGVARACRVSAERFDAERFDRAMSGVIDRLLARPPGGSRTGG